MTQGSEQMILWKWWVSVFATSWFICLGNCEDWICFKAVCFLQSLKEAVCEKKSHMLRTEGSPRSLFFCSLCLQAKNRSFWLQIHTSSRVSKANFAKAIMWNNSLKVLTHEYCKKGGVLLELKRRFYYDFLDCTKAGRLRSSVRMSPLTVNFFRLQDVCALRCSQKQ